MSTRQRYLTVDTRYDGLLETRIAEAADEALKSVDAETVVLFRNYGVKIPGDYSYMSWRRSDESIYVL